MAVIGYLGKSASEGVIFEVSDQTVRTLNNWKWSGSARYAVHNRHNYYFRTERSEVILPCFAVAAGYSGEQNGLNQMVLFPNFKFGNNTTR